MYIRGLVTRNFAESAEAVPIVQPAELQSLPRILKFFHVTSLAMNE